MLTELTSINNNNNENIKDSFSAVNDDFIVTETIISPLSINSNNSSSRDFQSRIATRFDYDKTSENSIFFTIFLLLNAMIGSGILNAPQVFMETGILVAIILIIITGYYTHLGLKVLIECGIQCKKYDYSDVANFILGNFGEKLVDFAIAISSFGALMSYIDIIGSTSEQLLYSWGCDSYLCSSYYSTSFLLLLIVLPICLKKVFGHLAIYSVISISSILAILFLVCIAGPIITASEPFVPKLYSKSFSGQVGSIIFSLSCAYASFHSFKSMKDPDCEKWSLLSGKAVIIGGISLILMGLGGYLSFGDDVNGMILNNFNGSNGYDIFKIFLLIHMCLFIPVDFMVMRHSIAKLIGYSNGTITNLNLHIIATIFFLVLPAIVVLSFKASGISQGVAFGVILDITGGIGGSLISFILPGLFYIKLKEKNAPLYKHCVSMIILGVFVLFFVPTMSIIKNL